MKQKQSSSTAEGMALVRAIESSRPADRRVCYDPIARSLINGFSFHMSKWFIDSGLYARMSDGALEFITARERYIDDFLASRLAEGLDQVVLLGAGFDTRAYRIPAMEKVRVFEVDHPATQQLKRKRLKKAVPVLPPNITFVPLDFNTQTIGERLPAAGYDEHARSLFIWQGVTQYLQPAGVDSTLAFIAGHSAPGSAVIFDYFTNEFLHGPDIKRIKTLMKALGEEHIFGIDESRVDQFLAQRGFGDVHNVTAGDLRELYFTGPNAGRKPSDGADIVSAGVLG